MRLSRIRSPVSRAELVEIHSAGRCGEHEMGHLRWSTQRRLHGYVPTHRLRHEHGWLGEVIEDQPDEVVVARDGRVSGVAAQTGPVDAHVLVFYKAIGDGRPELAVAGHARKEEQA